jgi:hypothetical protein
MTTFAEMDAQNRERSTTNQEPAMAIELAVGEPETFTPQAEGQTFDRPEPAPLPEPVVFTTFGAFTDERTIALVAALAQAQGEFEPIIKNREVTIRSREKGTNYTFNYADLDSIRRSTQPALSKHGLGVISFPTQRHDGSYLRTLVTHSSGGFMWAELLIPTVGQEDDISQTIKAFGGLMTYLRRYLLIGMLNLSADHDLDEDGKEAGGKAPEGSFKAQMEDAKTMQELAKVMTSIPEKEKKGYVDLFNRRSNELRQGAS